jgi:uncharacterized protein (DUF488 family)
MDKSMTVFTIGYEGIDIDTFMSLLVKEGIETVVDIRELPLSRKPGFSKRALAEALRENGLEYVHIVELGCPRPVRNRYREDRDWRRYVKGFMSHLKTQRTAIAELSERAGSTKCALVCYEADHNFCHRSMVATAVQDHSGANVKHIVAVNAKTGRPAAVRLAAA